MDYNNKTVWITGASSGIGEELAKQFAEQGAKVILSARNIDKLNQVKDELKGEGHRVVPLDLSKPETVLQDVSAQIDSLGPIDILINNGGVSQRSLFLENDFKVYRQLMEVNYFGLIALTKAVLPSMVARKSGSVVAISSVAGKVGSKFRTGYSGSKYAVVGFMDCLRAEVAQHNIHCLTICPGSIKTAIAHNSLNGQGEAQNKPEPSIENGMNVNVAASKMLTAIYNKKDEVVIGQGLSGWAPFIKRFFPSLFNRLTAKVEYK
ncbi:MULTISPECIES: SDR family oxidoreductase [unclassified Pseudoalteromonas]|jgi:dehydrogenase/reductase SDR family protein 7B|uniref:SDR family oxidoreductase n=1 Tax=Pseudoalteromonas TaxID=53246 RepID=UPI000560730D|nr:MULTISPECIES: SDR family oxidoreductase [unclassified Pseudoalteromonas]MDN3403562.1 SDR family oxidoreductase [Pseudoalteromonas sp. APC 3218]MDN3407401.1 SDR family oxidoreductase [Pseudoalteromonas sp. APC 3894]MDN3414712.1 SDR family oxidoreductase [Pseudoalteromonas sp. APC 3227]MDN3418410.1 SDR family oxidoreductase [Pseudoalteromonas sp. APC 3895]MDN3422107.1 SDR family oxidoreductase [Pseudoalteromonas sp. APC 3896]|tara:strand:- start:708 stop:1499 length:792 start_codon:yes stop_codon:yes gene_type:complete